MRRRGAEGVSFPPIFAAGQHGARPHAVPRDVPIPAGTLVVIDWGAQLDGYASDCTRTVATGELDPRDRAVYDVVLIAQLEALDAVRPGPLGKEVDAVARQVIDSAGPGKPGDQTTMALQAPPGGLAGGEQPDATRQVQAGSLAGKLLGASDTASAGEKRETSTLQGVY
jgi:hypothetical protein